MVMEIKMASTMDNININSSSVFSRDHGQNSACGFFGGGGRSKAKREDDYDAELAKEMNSLSVQEREKVLDDIHGVAQIYEETPEFVSKRLHELDLELSSCPKHRRRAYDRALFFRPCIANDKKFMLMFLRADLYDPVKAAKRLIKYFEDKLALFGEEKLAKDITINDLSEEDMEVYSLGWCLELPHKDQVGRPIWFFDLNKYDFDRPDCMIRCCWYMLMVSVQDEVAQKKGACNVAYSPGDLFAVSTMSKVSKLISQAGDVLMNLPLRITSYHYCYDDKRMQLLLSAIKAAFGKQVRLRLRTHFGSDLEMQYSLTTFGIPCKALLQNNKNGDDTKKELHQRYVERRRKIEQKQEEELTQKEITTGIILCPKPDDILIGRGRPYQDYSGNRRFGALIDAQLDTYHKCSDRFRKTCISMDVVKTVQEYGGRFIEKIPEGWKQIDDVVAREKTAIAFRSRVSKVTPDDVSPKCARPAIVDDEFDSGSRSKRLRFDPGMVYSTVAS